MWKKPSNNNENSIEARTVSGISVHGRKKSVTKRQQHSHHSNSHVVIVVVVFHIGCCFYSQLLFFIMVSVIVVFRNGVCCCFFHRDCFFRNGRSFCSAPLSLSSASAFIQQFPAFSHYVLFCVRWFDFYFHNCTLTNLTFIRWFCDFCIVYVVNAFCVLEI